MTNEERDLRNQDTWDFSEAVVNPGIPKTRAVVSVAFAREDYQQVVLAAEKGGMKTSEFIRSAALARAKSLTTVSSFYFAGMSQAAGIITAASIAPSTWSDAKQAEDIQSVISG